VVICMMMAIVGSTKNHRLQRSMKEFLSALVNREYRLVALKVALFVGSLLFMINHGPALLKGEMTPTRWASGILTYIVPYVVNIHGQYSSPHRTANTQHRK
jgi:hypothetical protein